MPPSSSQLRPLIANFTELTGVSERTAIRYLKGFDYDTERAVDAYLNHGGEIRDSPIEGKLNALFDTLHDAKNDGKDKMELDSTMSYFGDKLQVSLENAGLFVVMELVQAPSVGEIDRAGFVKGWTAVRCDTISSQADLLKHRISQLSTDMALFKKVYRHAFVAGRERDQKALSLENALVYWGMLFTEPGWRWESQNHNWLDYWKNYLSEKWTRTVSRDMWNMVLEFAFKSVEDETLSFWSEDGAWPSVIDDFVDWCKKKGITKTDSMEIDASS